MVHTVDFLHIALALTLDLIGPVQCNSRKNKFAHEPNHHSKQDRLHNPIVLINTLYLFQLIVGSKHRTICKLQSNEFHTTFQEVSDRYGLIAGRRRQMLDFHSKICDHVLVMSKQGSQACMDICNGFQVFSSKIQTMILRCMAMCLK